MPYELYLIGFPLLSFRIYVHFHGVFQHASVLDVVVLFDFGIKNN